MTRRILIINPNTTRAVTDRIVALGQALSGPSVTWTGATGAFGARYISDRASFTIAGHATLDAFARHRPGPSSPGIDAVLLACFGDPGLLALKEIAAVPVVGLAEASFAAASREGRRFAIVTGGIRWRPMLEQLVCELGYGSALAGIETLALTGGEIAAAPDRAIDALGAAAVSAAAGGADVVVLGGAGLAGLAPRVASRAPVPILCSVAAGLAAVVAALPGQWTARTLPRVDSIGLSPELAALLSEAPDDAPH